MFLCCWCYFYSTHSSVRFLSFLYIYFSIFFALNQLQSSGEESFESLKENEVKLYAHSRGLYILKSTWQKVLELKNVLMHEKSKQISLCLACSLAQSVHSVLCLAHEEDWTQKQQKWKIASNELWSSQNERKGLHIRHGRRRHQQDAPGKRIKYSVD